jgi:peptidoglycan-associated lipoprotein
MRTITIVGLLGLALVGAGCSKSIQVDAGSKSFEPAPSQAKQGDGGPKFGGLPGDGRSAASGKGSGEERVSEGIAVAKADSSGSSMQKEMQQEAGLDDVYFAYDSWKLSEESKQALSKDAGWLKANGSSKLAVEGHCDERGTQAYNLVLGQKRAKAVRNYLVELGVAGNRITAVSYGKDRPFCKESNEACYQQNRRGHLAVSEK